MRTHIHITKWVINPVLDLILLQVATSAMYYLISTCITMFSSSNTLYIVNCQFMHASLPFKFLQPLVTDLRDKMTGISLYGTITDIKREQSSSQTIFSMRVKETTGSIWAKLHFVSSWYYCFYLSSYKVFYSHSKECLVS